MGRTMKVAVSKSNSKIGKVLNVSLTPIKSCRCGAPCIKDCYACNHAYRLYPGTRKAWDRNLAAFWENPDEYFFQIYRAIKRAKSFKLFRWHVGGDIPVVDYLHGMVVIARAFPNVKFLCFTKQYEMVEEFKTNEKIPKNLTIVFSAWPGLRLPKGCEKYRPIAWMRDGKDPDSRIPKKAQECPGGCDKCMKCFGLKPGQSVVFDKH